MNRTIAKRFLQLPGSCLALSMACTVPEEVKVSLYDQGDALHGGPAAFQMAQGVLNGLELKEYRFEWMNLQELSTGTSCRLGIYLEGSDTPDGFVTAGKVHTAHFDTCDDLSATEERKAEGIRWTQAMLPYPTDIASQQAQADYAREYARATRMLGIEAEEWSVPNRLHSCIEERISELSAHQSYVSGLACAAYRDPSSLEIDHLRELLAGAQIRADQRLADSRRNAPEVPESLWGVDGINGRQERNVNSLPFSTTLTLEGTAGLAISLLRGETFTARLTKDEGYMALRLWNAESGNAVARDMAMGDWQDEATVSWTPARTETYVLAVSVYDGPRSVRVSLETDGTGTLTQPRKQELELISRRSAALSATSASSSTLVEMLRWENVGGQDACVKAALFSIEEYARNRAVEAALSECAGELQHRIQTRERVLELSQDENSGDD